jgi:hypothetical protein
MKRLSYLLATLLSALAALASSTAVARPANSDRPTNQNGGRKAVTPFVSEAARDQIRRRARLGSYGVASAATKSQIPDKSKKGKVRPKHLEGQGDFDDAAPDFVEGPSSFSQTPSFTEFSKPQSKPHSKPGDDTVKKTFDKHRKKKKTKKKY